MQHKHKIYFISSFILNWGYKIGKLKKTEGKQLNDNLEVFHHPFIGRSLYYGDKLWIPFKLSCKMKCRLVNEREVLVASKANTTFGA